MGVLMSAMSGVYVADIGRPTPLLGRDLPFYQFCHLSSSAVRLIAVIRELPLHHKQMLFAGDINWTVLVELLTA